MSCAELGQIAKNLDILLVLCVLTLGVAGGLLVIAFTQRP